MTCMTFLDGVLFHSMSQSLLLPHKDILGIVEVPNLDSPYQHDLRQT